MIAPSSTSLFLREGWALKMLHFELDFFLAKLVFGQRIALASTTEKMHSVMTGHHGYKQKDGQTSPRYVKMVFQIFLPLKMVCQFLHALAKLG